MARSMSGPVEYCAFCGKADYEVECLVSVDRPGAVIVCNRCVGELSSFVAALTPSALSGDAGEGRVQKYLADETAARAHLATFPDAVRQRLHDWQEGQSEWFSDTVLEIVSEFIAFDDAARQGAVK